MLSRVVELPLYCYCGYLLLQVVCQHYVLQFLFRSDFPSPSAEPVDQGPSTANELNWYRIVWL